MLITSPPPAIRQSFAEVYLTGVAPLEALSKRFTFNFFSVHVFLVIELYQNQTP
jgi:hypothetical protein